MTLMSPIYVTLKKQKKKQKFNSKSMGIMISSPFMSDGVR